MNGAIELNWTDGTKSFVILPIHEFRNSGAVFAIRDGRNTHLMSAGDVRGSWNGWVRDLISDDQIVDEKPAGMETY